MPYTAKILDADAVDRLIYTERPPCPAELRAVVQDCLNRAFQGFPDNQLAIAFCLSYAMAGHDPESIQKFTFIACTGRLPYVDS